MRHLLLAIALAAGAGCAAPAETTHTADDEAVAPPQDFHEEEGEMCLEPPPEETDPEPCEE